MSARTWLVFVLLAGPALAAAQSKNQQIQWETNSQRGIATAQQSHRPLMIYVVGSTDERENQLENAQRRSFANADVLSVSRRFVCVRVSRSQGRNLLRDLDLSVLGNMEIVFISPDAKMIDRVAPSEVAAPDAFCQKMAAAFDSYRTGLFNNELKPKLEDKEAKAADLKIALGFIREFTILKADETVVKVAKDQAVTKDVRAAAFDTLALLATKPAVETLLEAARAGDADAGARLGDVLPGGAEYMLEALEDNDSKFAIKVYDSLLKICQIKNKKPASFWEKAPEKQRRDELERVKQAARETAKRWRDQYAEYR
ncbi:hypothetical protein RAS1_39960 [Phycisphaerae bacterium RAS1]|nr:hypothetical protein RAS1_39960 [Phycisphaerae bacterium RAS1]